MKANKRKKLEAAGWKVASAREFLGLSEEDEDLIDLAAKVYDGLTEEEVDEVERLALDRRNSFHRPIS